MDDSKTDYEAPATTGEAPAEFGLLDEGRESPVDELSAASAARRHPLRFMWQMDAESRFLLGSEEFNRLIGARTAASFGRPWSEIAATFGIDPEGRVARAIATHDTWSGITVNWPVDGGGRLPVELSGLPTYDRAQNFAGYRGFGVCRDVDGLTRLAEQRRYELVAAVPTPPPLSADIVQAGPAADSAEDALSSIAPDLDPIIASETSPQTILETAVETPKNVLPFRPISETKAPSLTAGESNAFNELARQLSERLENEHAAETTSALATEPTQPTADEPDPPKPAAEQPEWLARPEAPARVDMQRDRSLLDLLPVGVLIYRLDRLLYANREFLERINYESLQALEEAGGLDTLYVEPGVSTASSTSGTGTPVTISAGHVAANEAAPSPIDAHLFTVSWQGDSALALIFSHSRTEPQRLAAMPAIEPSPVGQANAEELGAILDMTAEGIVMFDAQGAINSCNRSAEALFGYDGLDLVKRNLAELFAPESQRALLDYHDRTKGAGGAGLLDHGREALGRTREGGLIPLSITIGRTRPDGPNYFAVFRDLSQTKKMESDLWLAQRLAGRATTAKTDMLARISHEVRTPLNAIIGFADVMIQERFGALGNERYVEYMKDVRASGERVIAVINDLLDLCADRNRQAGPHFCQAGPQQSRGAMRLGDAASGQPRTHHHPHVARPYAASGGRRRPRAAPDRAEPDRQLDSPGQRRWTGHRLHRPFGFQRGGAAGARHRPRPQRQ